MVTIEIGNSYGRIIGLKTHEFKALRSALSYQDNPQAAFFSQGYPRTRYLLDKTGYFPTGLLPRVREHLGSSAYELRDTRIKPKLGNIIPLNYKFVPYGWQIDAAFTATHKGRGGIVATTGSGKSLVIALIASLLNVRTLVVVPSLEIQKQLSNSLLELLGAHPQITVENIDSTDLPRFTDFDCLIIDECHHAAAKTYQKLNSTAWEGIYYRFFLSATFFRNNDNENMLFEGICGQEIYRLDYKRAVDKGYICPIEAFYVDLPKIQTDAHTWRQVYNDLVINNDKRNNLIVNTLNSLKSMNKFGLCLVKEILHGEILSKASLIPFVNGANEASRDYIRQFNEGKIKQLIGTIGILGEGVDTKPAEYIIVTGLGKAKSQFMQQIGRGVRKYPGKESAKIIIFRDPSHKFTLRHFKEQKKILLEEYSVNILKL